MELFCQALFCRAAFRCLARVRGHAGFESVSMSGNLGSSAQLHWLGGTLDASDPFDVLVGPEGFSKNTNAAVASPIDASSAVGLANASASVTPDALTVSGHCTSSSPTTAR